MLPSMYHLFFKPVFLLPEWWKQLSKAALQKQKNNENRHPSKTRHSYFHPEQGGHGNSLQWPHPQIMQQHHYLKRERQSLLGTVYNQNQWRHSVETICSERTDRNLNRDISVGFKPAKAETHIPPRWHCSWQHRASFRDILGEPHMKEDIDFVYTTNELRASPNSHPPYIISL